MNYFLLLVILGMCGGFYYVHQQDQQQMTVLQQQLDDMTAKEKAEPASGGHKTAAGGGGGSAPAPLVAILPPDTSRSPAIDRAAAAAVTAAATPAEDPNALGTITTLDGRTFQDCKLLKVESDGITFNHADGITKVLFPLLRPEMQKKFGYDPQKAVAETAAQIQYQQSTQQAGATVPAATPNP